MNVTDIDNCVNRFIAGDDVFDILVNHYKKTCYNWYTHLSKYIRIDREEFENDFKSLLFRSLKRFNPDWPDDNADSKFDRYFMKAVRTMSLFIRRQRASKKKNSANTIALTKSIRIADNRFEQDIHLIDTFDAISSIKDVTNQNMMKMMAIGYTRKDVCENMNMPLHEYRARIGRIQKLPVVASLSATN